MEAAAYGTRRAAWRLSAMMFPSPSPPANLTSNPPLAMAWRASTSAETSLPSSTMLTRSSSWNTAGAPSATEPEPMPSLTAGPVGSTSIDSSWVATAQMSITSTATASTAAARTCATPAAASTPTTGRQLAHSAAPRPCGTAIGKLASRRTAAFTTSESISPARLLLAPTTPRPSSFGDQTPGSTSPQMVPLLSRSHPLLSPPSSGRPREAWPEPGDHPLNDPEVIVACPACRLPVGARRGRLNRHVVRSPRGDDPGHVEPDGVRASPLGPDGWCIARAP
jgi:hypothetical protein